VEARLEKKNICRVTTAKILFLQLMIVKEIKANSRCNQINGGRAKFRDSTKSPLVINILNLVLHPNMQMEIQLAASPFFEQT
jgi:hypothetical protein